MAWYDPRTWGATSRRLGNIESLLATIKQAYLVDLKLMEDSLKDVGTALKEANGGIFALLQQGDASAKRQDGIQEEVKAALGVMDKSFLSICKHLNDLASQYKNDRTHAQEALKTASQDQAARFEALTRFLEPMAKLLLEIKGSLGSLDRSQERSLKNWETVFKDLSERLQEARTPEELLKTLPRLETALGGANELLKGQAQNTQKRDELLVLALRDLERQLQASAGALKAEIEAVPGKIRLPEPVVQNAPESQEGAASAPPPMNIYEQAFIILDDAETVLSYVTEDGAVTSEEKTRLRNQVLGGSGLKARLLGTVASEGETREPLCERLVQDLVESGCSRENAFALIGRAIDIRQRALKLME